MKHKDTPANTFEKGNQFYKLATAAGPPKLFNTPDELWDAACEYFRYCVANPIPQLASRYGKLVIRYKVQAMSLMGLGLYLGLNKNTLNNYKKQPAFTRVLSRINDVIYVHNFSNAVVGFLKGRIINHAR